MKANEGEFPVSFMCSIFDVSDSGYYAWRKRDKSVVAAKEFELVRKIEQIHLGSRGTYGSPRVLRVLKGMGESCSKPKVERLMKKHGIRAKTKKKFKKTTDSKHNLPVAPNLLERNFSPEKPNQTWASDITYVCTKEGWLFLAVIVDLFSRQIVGWSLDKTMTRELVLAALRQACFRRKPGTGLIFHSDRGSQYCSKEFREQLRQYHMLQSQSRKGDCWDNAVVESFFHTVKTEAIFHEDFETRAQAQAFIFEWIEVFYNRHRLHSTLGYLSPVAFEEKACA
jgi:transposase InsO family protein